MFLPHPAVQASFYEVYRFLAVIGKFEWGNKVDQEKGGYIKVNGPEIWTGGIFGAEGGLIVTGLTLLNAPLILNWVKYTGRWKGIRPELAEYHDFNENKV